MQQSLLELHAHLPKYGLEHAAFNIVLGALCIVLAIAGDTTWYLCLIIVLYASVGIMGYRTWKWYKQCYIKPKSP